MPYLSFAAICLLFGTNFFLMDQANVAFKPMTIGAWRIGGAAVVMVLVWLASSTSIRLKRADFAALGFVGLISNAYPYTVMPWIISQGVPHSYVAMFVAYVPLLTLLLSVPMLNLWPTKPQVVGVLGGLGMLALVMLDGQRRAIDPWLLLLAVTVPLGYALGNITIRRRCSHLSGATVTMMISLIAGCVLIPVAISGIGPGTVRMPESGAVSPDAYWWAVAIAAWMGIVGTGLANWMFIRLIQSEGPLFAGMTTYVVPLVGLFWGVVDGEMISPLQISAILGVLAMVALVQYGGGKKVEGGGGGGSES